MDIQKLKIALLAKSGYFSDQTLLHISNHFRIDCVIFEFKTKKKEIKTFIKTQGRIRFAFFILTTIFRKLRINKIKSEKFDRIKYCQDQNIPYQIVNNHNSIESISALNKVKPDLIVICSSGIISQKIIDIPKIGVISGHPGWLPDFRGWDALRWAVKKDGTKGVTIHFIDKGIDTGDIILQEKINSGNFKNFSQLFNFALKLRLDLYIKAIGLVNTGEYPRIKQIKKVQSLYKRMSFWKQLQVNFILNKNFKKQQKR
jgi:methionyl-tRNA formyltransferase